MDASHLERRSDEAPGDIPPDWSRRRVTVEEAERANLVKNDRLGMAPIPFGSNHAAWKALLDQMVDGDELWEFCSPPESWRHHAGSELIALVRSDQIVAAILTRLS